MDCDKYHWFMCEKPLAFPCYSGWIQSPSGEICVKKFHAVGQLAYWSLARSTCWSYGGDLVTIHDGTMLNFITDNVIVGDIFPYWIGYNKLHGGNRSQWIGDDETPVHTYTNNRIL
ncbi:secretory phospholipase a2 receptor [Plakobranchus ocellatus]|uniref:Secretory phospholipase a2 receptor n=1 Tax=Plakobranchus ocellatus TaxID=259542 RepID=A0AAV4AT06_9GAST|nr:secretory phospholipase a2 receptor [Plakobranchus ocellatus]